MFDQIAHATITLKKQMPYQDFAELYVQYRLAKLQNHHFQPKPIAKPTDSWDPFGRPDAPRT